MKSFALVMVFMMAANVSGTGSGPLDLKSYKWKYRLLLVFASSPEDPLFQQLKREVERQRHEILDRDILMFHIFPNQVHVDQRIFDGSAAHALRKEYSIPSHAFGAILIGKDGGEKLRQNGRTDLGEIFSRIDAMPMRQREMKRQTGDD